MHYALCIVHSINGLGRFRGTVAVARDDDVHANERTARSLTHRVDIGHTHHVTAAILHRSRDAGDNTFSGFDSHVALTLGHIVVIVGRSQRALGMARSIAAALSLYGRILRAGEVRPPAAAVEAAGDHDLPHGGREIPLGRGLLRQIADGTGQQVRAIGNAAGKRRQQAQQRTAEWQAVTALLEVR